VTVRKAAASGPGRGGTRGRRPPLALTLPALLAVAFLVLPLAGVLRATPWRGLPSRLGAHEVRQALGLSLLVSGWALLVAVLLGVPLAWVLARADFPGKALLRSLVLLPMVLPPTVAGVALLQGFGRRGLLGPFLEHRLGIVLPFSTSGAVVAAAFVSLPFLVLSLEGALAGLRPGFEETAASLGASPLRTFATVTVPMIAPALAAGAALCWARALGEFGATITFAGNLPGVTQTLPLKVYLLLEEDPEGATAVSLVLLAVAMAVLFALRGRWAGGGGGTLDRRGTVPGDGDTRDRRGTASGDAAPDADANAPGGPAGTGAGAVPAALARAPHAPAALAPVPLLASVRGATAVELDAAPGTTIAVVGPNGAGKTTLLRALLGLTGRAVAAPLRLGGRNVSALAPHRRGIAWVPQDGALFPHLSVLGNAAYGLRAQGVPRRAARAEARAWLDRLGVGHLAARRPDRISGGQAGRVALARALASRPRLLLLDEPLAALDQSARALVRHTLRSHLAGFPGVCLIVTHDPVEAVSLADRVLVLEDGHAVQYAAPAEIARRPRSPWVARMLGRNAWTGTATADGVALPGGAHITAAEPLPSPGAPALAVAAPDAISLHPARPTGSPRNTWPATVRELSLTGSRVRVLLTAAAPEAPADTIAEITPSAAASLALTEGQTVWAALKATEVTVVAL
jgi:molybdate transport system permease protein